MPPSERLFFALQPEPPVRDGLQGIAAALPEHRGRPVHPADRHITLVFLGDTAPEQRTCAERAAAGVRARRFELSIDRVGYWPRPRILWAGCSHTPGALLELVQGLQQALVGCGFRPERRPYAPHITLARKAHKPTEITLDKPLTWPVRSFVLMGSDLDAPPPRYRVLARWPLG
jgi:2'-5' RNA ligase